MGQVIRERGYAWYLCSDNEGVAALIKKSPKDPLSILSLSDFNSGWQAQLSHSI